HACETSRGLPDWKRAEYNWPGALDKDFPARRCAPPREPAGRAARHTLSRGPARIFSVPPCAWHANRYNGNFRIYGTYRTSGKGGHESSRQCQAYLRELQAGPAARPAVRDLQQSASQTAPGIRFATKSRRLSMPRILGVDLPNDKPTHVSL